MHIKPVYSCVMMDKTSHDEMNMDMDMKDKADCCLDYMACLNLECEADPTATQDSCYNQTIVLTVNQSLQHDIPIFKNQVESYIDPPQTIVTTIDFVFPSQVVTTLVVFPRFKPPSLFSGSKTYLITQRLRT